MELRKLKRFSVLVALLFLFSNLLYAQTKTITGRVTDATGAGLPGATVTVKGTKVATVTDAEGRYTISVPASANSIIISSVGYGQQEIGVGTQAQINVTLQAAAASLNEVVVIGYGVQRKRDVTGAISKVSGDQISATPVPSFEAALQGKAPGVQIIQGNGLAGSGAVVRIRGIGSISASGDPLYVVDGIPVISDPFQRGNSGAMNQNPLASINPADIESIEVLKDAGATGIYGSRGANGVIIITTKRGKNGKPSFTYSNKLGVATYSQKPEFVNSQEWLQLRQEAWISSGHTGQAPLPNSKLTWQQAMQNNTDWWDEITRKGFINEHNLSFNQGTKKLKTFANLSYSDNQSYIKGNAYTRLSARLNMDYNVLQNLKVSLTSGYNRGINKRVPAAWDGGIGDAMSSALPIYPIYNGDKTYYTDGANPVRRLNETKRREIDSRLIGGLTVEYEPVKNLFLKAQGSIEHVDSYDDQFESYLWLTKSVPDSGFAKRTPFFGKNWTTTYTANYLWNANDDNKFNFLVGAEAQDYDLKEYKVGFGQWTSFGYWDKPSDFKDTLNSIPDSLQRAKEQWTFNSFFARVNYSLKNRYTLQLTARLDGSSKFGTNNKHGFFPAASAAWVISDEKFMKGIRQINFLKLRASYGIVGNANIASGAYYDNWQVGGIRYNGNPTLYLNGPGNPDLKWETMHNIDAGLEFGLFSSRLTGEIAYYHKTSTDILLQPGVQRSTGNEKAWRNLENSKILNEGIEISANVKIINKPELKWNVGGNIARNYNEVLEYELGPDAVSGGTNDTRIVKGLPIGVNYLVRYYGVDPTDGLPIWLDKNGKQTKTFSLDHRVYAGAVIPDYVGGFNTLLSYKNFDVSALFSFVIGGNIYENSGKYQFLGVSKKNWNFRKDFLDRWTQPGDESKYPKLVYDATDYPGVPSEDQFNSTMFLRDADYMRLRELSVSYRFTKGAFGKSSFIKDLRLFVTGTNLLTFTKFPGGDPEITRDFEDAQDRNLSPNITYLTAPSQRTVVFGINLNF
jgi:TonB-dependent starch-binding outer membrane protein SusC